MYISIYIWLYVYIINNVYIYIYTYEPSPVVLRDLTPQEAIGQLSAAPKGDHRAMPRGAGLGICAGWMVAFYWFIYLKWWFYGGFLLVYMVYIPNMTYMVGFWWFFFDLYGGFHCFGGTPIAGRFIVENPIKKGMITRGTPHFRKPPYTLKPDNMGDTVIYPIC